MGADIMLGMGSRSFGIIGLGTMGRNFLLNVARSGVSCAGYDLDVAKVQVLREEAGNSDVGATASLKDFFESLASPRAVMLFVPADLVDQAIEDCVPFLESGDLLIDGGNSHFKDTERRAEFAARMDVAFLGTGVSGGEEGARNGACIMAGGAEASFARVKDIFAGACARVGNDACLARVGGGSSGHFVKMVHNGIEYGLMQIVCEAYDLMRRDLGMESREIAEAFAGWNSGRLNSFLVEISAQILRKTDPETGRPLVELVLDRAAQKGTGIWTSQTAMDLGVSVPTIDAAVSMRALSSRKELRTAVADSLRMSRVLSERAGGDALADLEQAVYGAFLSTYAQGFSLIAAASREKGYGVDLAEVAAIWRGGCIIRSSMLELIRDAFVRSPGLESLLLDGAFAAAVLGASAAWRGTVASLVASGRPCPGLASALSYVEGMSSAELPANLLQAQRDLFGAHTYERTDRPGKFHTEDWK